MKYLNKDGAYIGALKVKQGVDLSGTNLKSLPDDLEIVGYLAVCNTRLKKLPNNLKATHLQICKSDITEIPADLVVKGNFDLSYTKVKTIPDTIEVWGDLDISYTDIETIPNVVGGKIIMDKEQERKWKKGFKK